MFEIKDLRLWIQNDWSKVSSLSPCLSTQFFFRLVVCKHIHGKVDIFLAPQVLECSPQFIESFDGLSIHQAIYMASGNSSLVLWLLRMLINFYLCIYALEVRANECKFLHTCLSRVSHALRICQWHKRICTSWPNTSLIAFISTSLQSIIRRFRLKLHSFLSQ